MVQEFSVFLTTTTIFNFLVLYVIAGILCLLVIGVLTLVYLIFKNIISYFQFYNKIKSKKHDYITKRYRNIINKSYVKHIKGNIK